MDAWFGQGGCLVVHPVDPGIVITGGQGTSQTSNWSFALSRTTNGGSSWTRAFIEQSLTGWCRALAMAPSDPDRVYAGGWVAGAGALGVSTNQGASWTRTAAPAETVFGLAVYPHDPLTVLAATAGGVYRSTNGGGGWTRLLAWTGARAIAYLPGAPDTIIVGGDRGARASWDGGANWVELNAGLDGKGVVSLATATTDAVWLFAGTSNGAAYRYSFSTGARLPAGERPARPRLPAIVRGALELPPLPGPAVLLDAAGRRVMDLGPGRNELGRLSPGVYFVRTGEENGGSLARVLLLR